MRRTLSALTVAVALAATACSGGATASPTTGASEPPASTGPTEPLVSKAPDPCAPTPNPGAVSASIRDFAFSPAGISATVGDTIVWTNEDEAPHTATLDDHPACTTARLAGGDSGGILFSAAGTYAFHCAVHPTMKGSITVTE